MRWVAAPFLAAVLLAGSLSRAADCNRNGVEDHADITSGASRDCNENGLPDECDVAPVNYGLRESVRLAPAVPNPVALTWKDLDRDGHVDLAVLHDLRGQGALSVHWNNRDGTLAPGTAVGTPVGPRAFAFGDLDGDGDLDFAVARSSGVSVFRQQAGRQFVPALALALGFELISIDAGDLDGDLDVDLVVVGPFQAAVLMNGPGGLAPGALIPVDSDPVVVAAVDLDGDADLDIATGNVLENVSILRNAGDGTFTGPRNFAAGGPAVALKAADLDGDGRTDLAALNREGSVSLLLNRGGASFATPRRIEVAPTLTTLVATDLDGDVDVDLAVGDESGGIFVLLNHGPALFTRPLRSDGGPATLVLAAGDVNGDGIPEMAGANGNNGVLALFARSATAYSLDCQRDGRPDDCQFGENDCNDNLVPDDCDLARGDSRDCDLDGTPDECQDDCNGNGVPDACDVRDRTSPDCNENGAPDECDIQATHFTFRETTTEHTQPLFSIRAGDFDRDGDQDLAAAALTNVALFENAGDGTFETREVATDEVLGFFAITAGDLDGDGDLDLATAGISEAQVLRNRGDGSFERQPGLTFGVFSTAMLSTDFDGDADLDLALFDLAARSIAVFLNAGGASFGVPSMHPLGMGMGTGKAPVLLAADLDGDSFPELVASGADDRLQVLRNLRDGTFRVEGPAATFPAAMSAVAGDWNADGAADLAVVESPSAEVILLPNDGEGRFLEVLRVPPRGETSQFLSAGDLDRDGDLDLAVAAITDTGAASLLRILLNLGDGRSFVSRPVTVQESFTPLDLITFDADGEGALDLAMTQVFNCPVCIIAASQPVKVFVNESEPAVSSDRNRNRIPDECEGPSFHRGDPSGDGSIDLSDGVAILNTLFLEAEPPRCLESADANNDGRLELTDAVVVLNFLFLGGPPPATPGPTGVPCGGDPDSPGSPGDLGCRSYPPCGF